LNRSQASFPMMNGIWGGILEGEAAVDTAPICISRAPENGSFEIACGRRNGAASARACYVALIAMTLADLIDLEVQLAPVAPRAVARGASRGGARRAPSRPRRRGRAVRAARRARARRPRPRLGGRDGAPALHRRRAGERLGLPPRVRRFAAAALRP